MSGFLLDTNVVSEVRKGERCAPNVDAWIRTVPPDQGFISVLVVGELTRGTILRRRSDPATANILERWLAQITERYSERILPVTLEVAEAWGKLGAVRPIPPEDGLTAATALVHGLTLVTRNVKNVQGLGVALLNPWL
jgi:predicted nucleic acid-binding protein